MDNAARPADAGEAQAVTPRGRGRPKVVPDDVQALQIVSMARKLFLAQGYGSTTMNDVVAACRISKRTLYRHFPGKTELLEAVVEQHRTTMLALPEDYDALPLTQALEQIFVIDIDEQGDAERAALLRLTIVEAAQYPEVGEIMRKYGADRSRMLLAEWLTRQAERGRVDIDDPERCAQILMDMVFGAVVTKKGHGPEWPGLDERKAYLRRCIGIFIHGVKSADS